ncbi:TetR/AcrR family transcriptional regulator [Nocardia alba]|uniref:TetR family transcriptional regulator n=1 Tax=Nocardia alba TaxID=225051 RepID=A0A4R1FNB9_9NOCA|nr:TetR family transcriptional regulator [Nocardia alba]TCJ95690.1 TetR family transcriptional regulator [Nocardia alba]
MSEQQSSVGRGVAATDKGARRRAQLLDAAEQILIEHGHAQLTMRAVADAAEVRLGHLQYYFPGHADLVAAVLDRTMQRSMQRLAPLMAAADHTVDASELPRMLLAEQHDSNLVRIYAELWALAGRDTAVASVVQAFYRTYEAYVAAAIGARHPGLSEAACLVKARVFTVLVEGAALFRSGIAATADDDTDAAIIATATALLGE